MTEKDQDKEEQKETAPIQPRTKSPDPEKGVRRPTLESSPAELPTPKTVQLTYQPTPPSRLHKEAPEEPSKQLPVVPPGDYEEDTDESPPVAFDDPEQDAGATEPPADETTGADKQPCD